MHVFDCEVAMKTCDVIMGVFQMVENCTRQNNSVDIYQGYFEEEQEVEENLEAPSAKTINTFR